LIRKTIGLGWLPRPSTPQCLPTRAPSCVFHKGGIYAALPIVTVFAVSFVHGAFASNLWSLLGVEATKKTQPRVAPKRPAPRKRPRPQLHLDA
jgi:hypothetical protein